MCLPVSGTQVNTDVASGPSDFTLVPAKSQQQLSWDLPDFSQDFDGPSWLLSDKDSGLCLLFVVYLVGLDSLRPEGFVIASS